MEAMTIQTPQTLRNVPFLFNCKDAEVLTSDSETGFGVVKANMARDGVLDYGNWELGLPYLDGHTNRYNILTTADELSLALGSFAHATLTNDHPYVDKVDLTNWDELAMGEVSTDTAIVVVDGVSYANGTIIVKNKTGMAAIRAGQNELSMGALCDVVMQPGEYTDASGRKIQYDGYKTNIRANHIALVDRGRAGAECAILMDSATNSPVKWHLLDKYRTSPDGDNTPSDKLSVNDKESEMTIPTDTRTLMIGDAKITGLTATLADSVEAAMTTLNSTHEKALNDAKVEAETALGLKDAELTKQVEANTVLTDELKVFKDAANEAERTALLDTAKSLNVTITDSADNKAIKLAVLDAKSPGKYTTDTADEVVNAVFDAFTAPENAPHGLANLSTGDTATKPSGAQALHDRLTGNANTTTGGNK